MRHGGGERAGQTVRGAPRSARMRQPVCRPAGRGLLSLGFTRQVQSSGGGAPNPPQPHLHLRARMGERTARDLGRDAPQRIPRRTEAQVLPSRRDTLGGAGGVRALYICIQLYIDEFSPANLLNPSIALASRT